MQTPNSGNMLPQINSTADVQASLAAASASNTPPVNTAQPASTNAQQDIQNFVATSGQRRRRISRPVQENIPDTTVEGAAEEHTTDKTLPGANTAKAVADAGNQFFSSVQIRIGLGIAVVVLFFFIWALIPTASGYTRLQLLWFTLIGQTKLTTDTAPSPNDGTGGSHLTVDSSVVSTPQQPVFTPLTQSVNNLSSSNGAGPESHTNILVDWSNLEFMG